MEDISKKETVIEMEGLEGLSPEEQTEKLKELYIQEKEAKKKLEADTDRGIRKVLEEKKYLESVNEVMESRGNLKLLELWESNPDVADRIAMDKFGLTKEEAIDYWKENGFIEETESQDEEVDKKTLTKDDIKDLLEEEKVNEFINSFKKTLDEDNLKLWEAEFKDLTEGKKLNSNNIKKYARLAKTEITVNTAKVEDEAKNIALGGGTSGGKGDYSSQLRKQNIEWLKTRGIF